MRLQTEFPKTITAGLTLKADLATPDYPAPAWAAIAYLRGPASIDIQASALGTLHAFAVPGAETSDYAPGLYSFSVRVTDGSDVFEVASGRVEVVADTVALEAGHDPRGHAERTLAAIEAVIEGRASKDQQSYTINGRTLVRTSISELLQLRETYRREVARLKGGSAGRRLMRRKVRVVM